ncbi:MULTISPECIES: hypothetical protein [unclassified Massilia]|uniref:hypothetical protein n=1 Tax=unclassified Massilia TaxID=2609279 RepID=UPI0012E21DA3|nr:MULTISPECIES: hypothetical protein [unclassified Massilia]
MNIRTMVCALLMACAGMAQAQRAPADVTEAPDDHGAYLSLVFGNGRIHGGNAEGYRWMRGRTFEVRAGRQQRTLFGSALPDSLSERIDFVHYNEGHPDNNHRDGFAVQWLMVRKLGAGTAFELGVGPYLSMNTTVIDGRQIDDAKVGALVSLGLRLPLGALPSGTHLRIGYNHVQMRNVHRSDALMIGIGRQFGRSEPDPETDPADGQTWFGVSVGNSITNMSGTDGAIASVLEVRRYLGERMEHWAVSGKFLFEGDDGARVDRRGAAAQLWYVQRVTPRFAMSAGLGPYVARNRRDDNITHANLLISFQAEHALSRHLRAFMNFNRVKTFRQTDDRDLFQLGLLKDF